MFPYKVQVYHKMLSRDFVPRVNDGESFLHNMNDDILDAILFADEAFSLKISLWIAISRKRIISMFFDHNVNSVYCINIFTPYKMMNYGLRNGYFQQDNATAHAAKESMIFLRQFHDDPFDK
ncbi:hypothetical protein BDFB_012817 [Asbolus verrucosus]|uniref:DDE 3 domain containing protein n=1 Tax=Asbolus verrucosus TaxID=1661398 RepID=A0A482WD47_ASBVE|nr:hypothetical protein BDFB_012817 [Asbolus verrucosus]